MSLQDHTPRPRKQKPLVVTDRLRLQRVFARMKQSCYSPTHESYPSYGGRGIYVCAEWLDTGSSEAFVQWAQQNGYQHGLEINRIDNNGPYSPENCNFITRAENNINQRHTVRVLHEGVLQPARPLLAALLPNATSQRLDLYVERVSRYGLTVEEAAAKPIGYAKSEKGYLKSFFYNGKLACLVKHMADAGLPTDYRTQRTVWARKKAGWSLLRMFTEPIAHRTQA